jgi:hypothetical protein
LEPTVTVEVNIGVEMSSEQLIVMMGSQSKAPSVPSIVVSAKVRLLYFTRTVGSWRTPHSKWL